MEAKSVVETLIDTPLKNSGQNTWKDRALVDMIGEIEGNNFL